MTQISGDPVPWLDAKRSKLCGACLRRWGINESGEVEYYYYQHPPGQIEEDITTCPECRRSTTR